MKLSETHLSYLRMFAPGERCVALPSSIGKTLEIKGLVEAISTHPNNRGGQSPTKAARRFVMPPK